MISVGEKAVDSNVRYAIGDDQFAVTASAGREDQDYMPPVAKTAAAATVATSNALFFDNRRPTSLTNKKRGLLLADHRKLARAAKSSTCIGFVLSKVIGSCGVHVFHWYDSTAPRAISISCF
jgi:hypothetical protein